MNTNEKELTLEQEDLINDCHEKKLMEEEAMEENEKLEKSRIKKTTYINPDRLDQILKRIGRKKLDDDETYGNLKEIKEVKSNE